MTRGAAVTERVGTRARVAVFLLGMCALISVYSTQPVLAQIARWAAVPEAEAAWTVSATTLGVAVHGALRRRRVRSRRPQAGDARRDRGAADRDRALLGAGSFGALLAFRFLQGLATPFVFAVAVAYIGDEFAPAPPRG